MNHRMFAATAAALSLGAALPAAAAESGPYVVAFGGQSSFDAVSKATLDQNVVDLLEAFDLELTDAESSLDDSDTMFGITVGYQVNPYFAAELSYVDLGSVTYRATGTATDGVDDYDLSLRAEASADGPVASVLLIWPAHERFSPYVRAGLAVMNTEGEVSGTIELDGEQESAAESDSTTRSNFMFGVGADIALTERFGLRLEWSRYADVGSDDVTGETDIDTFLGGVIYRF